tara:strand:+ start:82 stop:222 length:141 start_codon:yes stop_codon:yes gene_type:complete
MIVSRILKFYKLIGLLGAYNLANYWLNKLLNEFLSFKIDEKKVAFL